MACGLANREHRDEFHGASLIESASNHTAKEGFLREALEVLKATVREWLDDKASRLAAGLSFYTTLSLAPLLLLIVSIVGLVVGPEDVQRALADQAEDLIGESGRELVRTVFANADRSGGILGTVFGLLVLAMGATGMVAQIQEALNLIWGVERLPGSGIRNFLRKRIVSFAAILGIGFLLLVSLVASTAVSLLADWTSGFVGGSETMLRAFDFVISFVLFSVVFAFMYKFLPDVIVHWRDVWIGGVATAGLFVVGKLLVGVYLGSSGTASAYGVFGSLVVVLVWVYYSSQIVFFGAELTQVLARRYGSGIEPEEGARWLPGSDGSGDKERRSVGPGDAPREHGRA